MTWKQGQQNEDRDCILNDERPIEWIVYSDSEGGMYKSSAGFVIEAYGEEMRREPMCVSYVPYFRVLKNGVVIARVPAHMVEVGYKREAP